ncbi:ClpP-like prohead protease/major capsid protein fusion protein [Shewanella algae]|uniref:ClpP-like prohead protease/major capsid protein fusion protein n=1 Tax=Shewanella algae TaxID=38313 RepID=UPI001443A69E|nr:ClpP-like prohead protease/major capsid protein fusion protein [Shewanella algae]NKZ40847.1 Clp protease ClpP [Shewanella algae]QTE79873.1 ATP-dependent Clp protease proteolytic subunit [Shewanella algae]
MKRTHLAAACATALTSAALIAPQGALTPTNKPEKSWYSLKASANGEAELMIYDEIGGWGITAKQFARDLKDLGKITQLIARIHSPGGDVFEGMAIYNILKNYPAHKVAHIDGLAASMASVIAMAFDEVVMPENAMMMVHKPWGGTMGDADDMRKYADLLDKVEGNLVGAYRDKTGMTDEQLHALLAEETWLTGREAVEKGFADTLTEPLAMAASLQSNRMKDYANMPKALQILLAPQANSANPQNVPTPAPVNQPAPSPAPSAQPTQEQINAAAAELNRTRVDGLNTLFASWPQFAELKNECIADVEMTAEKAKDKILAKLGENTTPAAAQPRSVIIHAGNGNLVGDSIRAHIMARAGHGEHEKDNGYSSYNLRELARASLVDRGISVASMNVMQMVGLAFTHSSSDFGNILLDVANKSVLKGWEAQPESFERFCKKGQLSDFKIANRVGLDGFKALDKVEEGAEYKYATLSDHGEKIMLATYGKIFSITRQAIINDDMNMLMSVPEKMGRAAKRTIGNLVWAIITGNPKMSDNKALFHADHKNLGSGAPSVETISALCELMESQMIGEESLNIQPAFAMVPPNLKRTMLQTVKSSSVKGADVNAGIANPIQDLLEVISEPRLKTNSDKAWYVAAGLGEDTIEVAYLDGIDTPYIEQQDGFTVDGVATKVRIDAGVAPLDYRGLAKSTGV